MENVIALGKLIGLLFCSLPTLSFVFENSKNTRNELARPVMGTIFLVYYNSCIYQHHDRSCSLTRAINNVISVMELLEKAVKLQFLHRHTLHHLSRA